MPTFEMEPRAKEWLGWLVDDSDFTPGEIVNACVMMVRSTDKPGDRTKKQIARRIHDRRDRDRKASSRGTVESDRTSA